MRSEYSYPYAMSFFSSLNHYIDVHARTPHAVVSYSMFCPPAWLCIRTRLRWELLSAKYFGGRSRRCCPRGASDAMRCRHPMCQAEATSILVGQLCAGEHGLRRGSWAAPGRRRDRCRFAHEPIPCARTTLAAGSHGCVDLGQDEPRQVRSKRGHVPGDGSRTRGELLLRDSPDHVSVQRVPQADHERDRDLQVGEPPAQLGGRFRRWAGGS